MSGKTEVNLSESSLASVCHVKYHWSTNISQLSYFFLIYKLNHNFDTWSTWRPIKYSGVYVVASKINAASSLDQ